MIRVLGVLVCFVAASCAQVKKGFYTSRDVFPADGVSGGVVEYFYQGSNDAVKGPFGDDDSVIITAREKSVDSEKIFFKSSGKAGRIVFNSESGEKIKLTFYKSGFDSDGDGFPDDAELSSESDRAAFKLWFVRIAESQFLKKNYSWNAKERDCAGLIRFSYREALKKHDPAWMRKSGITLDKNIPDVERFNYPNVPLIGERIFKIKKGEAGDINSFGTFADASVILEYNTVFVSRRIKDAEKGDILFFNIDNLEFPYHSMIVTETAGDLTVVYNTGKGDVVKRVSVSYLKGSGAFEPNETNKNFVGIYRFKILE